MRSLPKKLLRDLRDSRGLLLAVTSIIAVGVTCYVAMRSAHSNLRRAKNAYYRQCRMADFWIDVKKVPVAELERLERVPGIAALEPRIAFHATVDLEGVDQPVNGLILSVPAGGRPRVNDFVPRQGSGFSSERDNEVVVNDAFARRHGLYPGQWIHLLLNHRRHELFIVGTAIGSEFTYLLGPGSLVPDPSRFGVFYVKQRFAEDVFDFQGAANQIVGRLAPEAAGAGGREEEVLQRAERLLEEFGVANVTPLRHQMSNQFITSEIDGLGAFARVLPSVFLVVAALVLNVLMTRLVRQQRTIVGTLKALGYTDGQVFRHFLAFGAIVGLAGGVAGCGLGYLAASGLMLVYRHFYQFPELPSEVYFGTHGMGLLLSLACAVAGSLRGARHVLHLPPAEAMRPEPPRYGRRVWLERFPRFWNRLSAGWRMAFRSLARHRFRSAAAVFAAAMGTGLLVNGFMMVESQEFLLDFQFQRLSRSDIDLSFRDEEGRDAWDEIARLPGVDHAEPTFDLACTFVRGSRRRKSGLIGVSPKARLTVPRDVRGEPLRIPETGLVLSRRLATLLDVRVGERVVVQPSRGERRPVDVPVMSIADSFMGTAAYADQRFASRLVGEEFVCTGVQLLAQPGRTAELYRELKQRPGIQSVVARREIVASLTQTLLQNQRVFIGVLLTFSAALLLGSITNASVINLTERRREVATLKALGYTNLHLGSLFLRENLLTAGAGLVLGFPSGWLLTAVTARAYESDVIRLPVVFAPWIVPSTAGLALLFALLAHGVVQRQIERLDYVETLKVKE